ncbi:MAG: GMC family oxidoreductase [Acidobacteriaceae bacterium]
MSAAIKQPKYSLKDAVDFLIIGAGAAGGVLAKELSTNGFRVVVLEQGPFLHEKDFGHDEYKQFQLGPIVNHGQKQTFRYTEQEEAKPNSKVMYGRVVGGGSVHFTANCWRFHEIDFKEAGKKGTIAGTGFADWPITYQDLEPYYTKVDWEVGVSGEAGTNPFEPPRSKPYPVPPMPVKSSGVLFERGARKMGWHPFPAPLAVLSQPYKNRNACMHCGFCEFFGCEMGAKSSTLASVIPEALKTGRCEIRPESRVTKVLHNSRGRVTGATYIDKAGAEHFQRARAVVISANGAETPRLLLLSASSMFPNGLANSSGKVGRYLMFNSASFIGASFEHPLNDYRSIAATRVIHDFYEIDPKHGFYGGGGIDARFDFYPIGFAFGGLPPDVPKWGAGFKAALRHYFTHSMFLLAHGTSLPLETNNITLDPNLKDDLGLPALRVTYKVHEDDIKLQQFLQARGLELLDAAGAQKKWPFPIDKMDFGVHLLGTCRMGKDPKSSVINADHQTHDVPNLFLCDGGSFVTSGRGQPTMTIMALAFRAADRMTALAKRGEI